MLKNLADSRKEIGCSQKKMAEILGISERQYQRLEAGTSGGHMSIWKTLSKMFNCTIDRLLEQQDEN